MTDFHQNYYMITEGVACLLYNVESCANFPMFPVPLCNLMVILYCSKGLLRLLPEVVFKRLIINFTELKSINTEVVRSTTKMARSMVGRNRF